MQAVGLDEALARAEAFAEAGADVLFIDALESEDEMRQFTQLRGVASGTPKMASLLSGGKTPALPVTMLQQMGFKLVAYPLNLLGVTVKAMQTALRVRCCTTACHVPAFSGLPTVSNKRHDVRQLQDIKDAEPPSEGSMPTFEELQALLGFPEYFEEAKKYGTVAPALPPTPETPAVEEESPSAASAGADSPQAGDGSAASAQDRAGDQHSTGAGKSTGAVEADAVFEEGTGPDGACETAGPARTPEETVRPPVLQLHLRSGLPGQMCSPVLLSEVCEPADNRSGTGAEGRAKEAPHGLEQHEDSHQSDGCEHGQGQPGDSATCELHAASCRDCSSVGELLCGSPARVLSHDPFCKDGEMSTAPTEQVCIARGMLSFEW